MNPYQIANIMKLAICVATLALLDNAKGTTVAGSTTSSRVRPSPLLR